MFGTGSYGRNDQGDATADAAVLSKHLGRPVRVQYMRHEGLGWDPKGTAAVNRSRAGLDAAGRVIAYENISKAFSRTDINTRESRAADVLAGHLLGFAAEAGAELRDSGRLLHVRQWPARLGDDPAAPGPRLAAAHHPSARSLRAADPVRQRILHGRGGGGDRRPIRSSSGCAISTIRATATPCASPPSIMAGTSGPSPRNDQARTRSRSAAASRSAGISTPSSRSSPRCGCNRNSGKIEIARYVCAHDVGLIVNPETLRHVIDRQLVYGTSRAMFEEVRFDSNMVTSVDWLTYPVLHIDAVPETIEIVLIERPEAAPSGAAEMALGLVPAAIGNAVFDATGVRLRRVPFTPQRVKTALRQAAAK